VDAGLRPPKKVMINVKRELPELKDEDTPELQVVVAANGPIKQTCLSAPLVLPSRTYTRPPRPELAVLGWSNRAIRLAARK
jgi:hypothetical protein